ncbi:hypothetical protein KR032_004696 [Drosophila birchii]|nr:hypothetical protein KR032_004696 [Drosophila birchii]
MKFYPDADVWCYVEKPSCMNNYIRYPPNHSWKINDKTTSRVMRYWRDSVGIKKPDIKLEDLYFTDWSKTRIRPQACLGLLYATGNRFIKLTMAPPAGFKCAPMPVNLATARIARAERKAKKEEKARKAAEKKAKKEAEEKEKERNKYKSKPKVKPGDAKEKEITTYKDAEKAK